MNEPTLEAANDFEKARSFIQNLMRGREHEDCVTVALDDLEKGYEVRWFAKALALHLKKNITPPGWDPEDFEFVSISPLGHVYEYIRERLDALASSARKTMDDETLKKISFWKSALGEDSEELPSTRDVFEKAIENFLMAAGPNARDQLNTRLIPIHDMVLELAGDQSKPRLALRNQLGILEQIYDGDPVVSPRLQQLLEATRQYLKEDREIKE